MPRGASYQQTIAIGKNGHQAQKGLALEGTGGYFHENHDQATLWTWHVHHSGARGCSDTLRPSNNTPT